MEGSIFPKSAVADLMKPNLVEARIHTDTMNTLTEEQFAANSAARDELAGNFTMPYFVVVDPHTGDKLGEFELSGSPEGWEALWTEFLNGILKAAGR
ncbi:MAG: hypothetical protein KDC98_18670 [Planctomycetes bacterium]|nr:hypothetical protein [Planctomycetota bacterium]